MMGKSDFKKRMARKQGVFLLLRLLIVEEFFSMSHEGRREETRP